MALSSKQIQGALSKYRQRIIEAAGRGALPLREDQPADFTPAAYRHMLYMCMQMAEWCDSLPDSLEDALILGDEQLIRDTLARREKLMRWLSWLQAKLDTHKLVTLAECKDDLRPPVEVFSNDGGAPTITKEVKDAG